METPRLKIRTWQRKDAQALALHFNNIHIWNTLRDRVPFPYQPEDALSFINICMQQNPPRNFAITFNDAVVGGIGLVLQEDIKRYNAEIGYWLSEEYWNQGIITEALEPIIKYAFECFSLHRIEAKVFSNNSASIRVLSKWGFSQEAILKEAVFKNGQWLDEHCFVLFKAQIPTLT